MNKPNRRRQALRELASSILKIGTGSMIPDDGDEKVKLLTADGEVVEVDADLVKKAGSKSKTTNQEILDWSNRIKT